MARTVHAVGRRQTKNVRHHSDLQRSEASTSEAAYYTNQARYEQETRITTIDTPNYRWKYENDTNPSI